MIPFMRWWRAARDPYKARAGALNDLYNDYLKMKEQRDNALAALARSQAVVDALAAEQRRPWK